MSESTAVRSDLYLYGIVLAGRELPAMDGGVQGSPVRTEEFGRIAAVLGDLGPTDALGTPDDLRAHTGVLDEIAKTDPILPLAFGTVVPGDSSIEDDVLAPREQEYFDALTELDGLTQYTVLVRFDRDAALRDIIADNPEAAQLRHEITDTTEDQTRMERIRLGELVVKTMESWKPAEAEPILERLASVTSEIATREGGQAEDVVEVAVLVPYDAAQVFDAAVEELAEEAAGRLRYRLIGPQAPYDFVGEP